MRPYWCSVFVVSSLASCAFSQLCFEERVIITSLFDPNSAIVADIDQDGDLDIVSTDGQTPSMQSNVLARIVWYENDGEINPGFTERFLGQADFDSDVFNSIRVVDFNGDGYPDVFARLGSGTHFWFENSGSPSFGFTCRETGWGGTPPRFFADVDGDGNTDIVQDNSRWFRYTGTGSTHFQQLSFNSGFAGSITGAEDLDGDGDRDILTTSQFWYENDGGANPQFTQREINPGSGSGGAFRAIDLDGDTDLDLLSDSNYWWRNDLAELGIFTFVSVSGAVGPLTPADVNLDGHVDFVDGDQRWWWSLSSIVYIPTTIHPSANGPFTARDLDGDGDIDLVNPEASGWYRNNLIGSGSVSFTEESYVGLNPGSTPRMTDDSLHDMNGDGDLDAVLNRESAPFSSAGFSWFINSTIRNTRTGARYGSLDEAVSETLNGDTLIGDPGIFDCATELILFDRDIEVRSTGDMYVPAGLMFYTGSIEAAEGSDLFFRSLDSSNDDTGGLPDPFVSGETVRVGSLSVGTIEIAGDVVVVPPAIFSPSFSFSIPGIKQIRTGDLDDDGDLDTIVLDGNGNLSWFAQQSQMPSQAWDGVQRPIPSAVSESFEVGDMNNDGLLDIIGHDKGELFLFLNNGTENGELQPFTLQTIVTGIFFLGDIAVGDMDNDGDLDLIHGGFGSKSGGSVRLFTNNGANPPAFSASTIFSPRYLVHHVSLVDLEGDGDLDVLMAEDPPLIDESGIVILTNSGASPATFSGGGVSFYPPTAPSRVYGGDFDGDTIADVLALYPGGFSPRIMLLESQRGYQPRVLDLGQDFGGNLEVFDFDSDGDLDFMTGTSVLYDNTGRSPATFRKDEAFANTSGGGVGVPIHAVDYDENGAVDVIRGGMQWASGIEETSVSLRRVVGISGDFDINRSSVHMDLPDIVSGPNTLSVGGTMHLDPFTTMYPVEGRVDEIPLLINTGLLSFSNFAEPDTEYRIIGNYAQYEDTPSGEVSGSLSFGLYPNGAPRFAIQGSAALSGSLIVDEFPSFDVPISGEEPLVVAVEASSFVPGRDRFDVYSGPILTLEFSDNSTTQGTVIPVYSEESGVGATVTLVPITLDELLFSQNTFGSQGTPNDAVLADITGAITGAPDGDLDLVVAVPEIPGLFPSGAVAVFEGSLTVNGFEMVSLSLYTGAEVDSPVAVEVGYFDNDAVPEIAFANGGANGNNNDVHFLHMNSSLPNPFIPAPLPSIDIQGNAMVTDMSSDRLVPQGFGPDDLLVGVQSNSGGGTILAVAFDSGGWESCQVDVDDVDTVAPTRQSGVARGVVFANVVVSNPDSDTITYFLNTGDFENMVALVVSTGTKPTEVVSGDLNLDGADDLVVICEGFGVNPGVITVSRNLGNDSFAPPVDIPIGVNPEPKSLTLSDVDDDGDLDLVLVSMNDGGDQRVRVIRNTSVPGGGITFAAIVDSPNQPAGVPAIVRAGDLDGDSPDIPDDIVVLIDPQAIVVGAGASSNSVDLSGAFCAADMRRDGVLDFFDVSTFLTKFAEEDQAADFTSDGVFDFFDLSAFLAAYMAGCGAS